VLTILGLAAIFRSFVYLGRQISLYEIFVTNQRDFCPTFADYC